MERHDKDTDTAKYACLATCIGRTQEQGYGEGHELGYSMIWTRTRIGGTWPGHGLTYEQSSWTTTPGQSLSHKIGNGKAYAQRNGKALHVEKTNPKAVLCI